MKRPRWDSAAFRASYVAAGGSPHAARSYVSYLNRADRVLGGLLTARHRYGSKLLADHATNLPGHVWGGDRERRDSLSALRRWLALTPPSQMVSIDMEDESSESGAGAVEVPQTVIVPATSDELALLLTDVRAIAARYYRTTGKPLGATGEIAELTAADLLGLTLCAARTAGYDALDGIKRVQIKGRAVDRGDPYRGRCPSIICGDCFDYVLLVLLDRQTLLPIEIWRADEADVAKALAAPGSRARNERHSLGIRQFRAIANPVWQPTV